MSWTLTIPIEIPSQNVTNKWHWSKEQRHLKHCVILMRNAGSGLIPPATIKRSCHILAFRKQRCSDIGNLIGGAKWFVDALVKVGLLVDDKDKMAAISYDQSTLRHSPTPGVACTVITLEDINLAS